MLKSSIFHNFCSSCFPSTHHSHRLHYIIYVLPSLISTMNYIPNAWNQTLVPNGIHWDNYKINYVNAVMSSPDNILIHSEKILYHTPCDHLACFIDDAVKSLTFSIFYMHYEILYFKRLLQLTFSTKLAKLSLYNYINKKNSVTLWSKLAEC